MKESLKIVLDQLDLIENKAVFFRNKDDGEVFDGFSSDTNKKLDVIKPDAFYVFNKQPFVLFFDLTSNIDVEKETEIHKKVNSLSLQLKLKEELKYLEIQKRQELEEDIVHLLDK